VRRWTDVSQDGRLMTVEVTVWIEAIKAIEVMER